MSFQICIRTDKSLQQLAMEIRDLLSLPPFTHNSLIGEPYCQFEMFGMLVLIHRVDDEDLEPEVKDYPYSFDLQLSFTESEIETDDLEYRLQPYYAHLLAFKLGVNTAHHEKQKVGQHWLIRYRYYQRNPHWDDSILYGEQGWQSAIIAVPPSEWRSMHPVF